MSLIHLNSVLKIYIFSTFTEVNYNSKVCIKLLSTTNYKLYILSLKYLYTLYIGVVY